MIEEKQKYEVYYKGRRGREVVTGRRYRVMIVARQKQQVEKVSQEIETKIDME